MQFQLQSLENGSPFEKADEITREWIRAWYNQWRNIELILPTNSGVVTPEPGHSIEIEREIVEAGSRLTSVKWSYPGDGQDGLLWQSAVTIAEFDSKAEFSLSLRVGSNEFRVAPPGFELKRPHLVKVIVDTLSCSLGGRAITTAPRTVSVEDVESLVAHLKSKDRRLPVIVVSREPYSDQFLTSPARIANRLVGLADVVMLDDKWASFRLTSSIGKPLSCYNGAIRLYWPGQRPDGSVWADHPLLPGEVSSLREQVADRLMRRLAPIAAFRFAEMETTRRAREAVAQFRSKKADQLKEQIASGKTEKAALEKQLLQALEEAAIREGFLSDMMKQRDAAIQERDDALGRSMELEEDVKQLKENLQAIAVAQPTEEAGEGPGNEQEPDGFDTVLAAVEFGGLKFRQNIMVLDTARDSAGDSDFARPEEVYQALMAIRDVSDAYFKAKKNGAPIGSWDVLFHAKGFKYAAGESQTTLSMYGKQRDFTNDGVKRRFLKHLTLGGGDRKNCLQIYFDVDEKAERFLVAYCGRHLDTEKYN